MNVGSTRVRVGVILFTILLILTMVLNIRRSGSLRGHENDIDLRAVLSAAIDLTERAGVIVKKVRRGEKMDVDSKGTLQNGVDDVVTNADLMSHFELMSGFKAAFPSMNVRSEEHPANEQAPSSNIPRVNRLNHILKPEIVDEKDITIWIDPLDATKEYTENLVEYVTVMACIAVKGVATAGVIHQPFFNRTVWGLVGHGTSMPFHRQKFDDQHVRAIVSRSHKGTVESSAKALGISSITPAGGAGFKVLQVLEDKADVYMHKTKIKKWDVCAGDAILQAAGGTLSDWKGNPVSYGYDSDEVLTAGLLVTGSDEAHTTLLKRLADEKTDQD